MSTALATLDHLPLTDVANLPDFRQVFDQYYEYVWSSLRRLGVHEADREDVASDVFLRVHDRLDEFDPSRPLRPWLFAFAVRAASEYRKLARHRTAVGRDEDSPGPVDPRPLPDQNAMAAEDARLVAAALETLDLPLRAVFVLHEIEQESIPVVAEALGIPLGTAYTRLRSAREDFRVAVRRLRRKETSR